MSEVKLKEQQCIVTAHSVMKGIYSKQRRYQKIKVKKKFLQDVLNQSKMNEIRNYLKKNQQKYAEKFFEPRKRYSLYEDYLLLNTLKECEDKIYENNMHFQISSIKIKNTKRTLIVYYHRLQDLMNQLEITQRISRNQGKKYTSEIKNYIVKHLKLLLDNETLQILQKYVVYHEKELDIKTKTKGQLLCSKKSFTLLQDCIILKEFNQKMKQNETYLSISKKLSEKLNRNKHYILRRLYNLFHISKEKLTFCISNNIPIKIRSKIKQASEQAIQNMKIFVNQIILEYLKQQFEKVKIQNSSQIDIQLITKLMILMYVKKCAGFTSLSQIFEIVAQKILLNKMSVQNKFYRMISKKNLRFLQKIEKQFHQIQLKIQTKQIQGKITQKEKVHSKQNSYSFKDNGKMLNNNADNISQVDTFINKLRQSNFKQNPESIMNILREIESSVKNQNSYFIDQHAHEELFFSDQQQKQDSKNHNHSLFEEEKGSKKQKKTQKQRRKSKIMKLEQNDFRLTQSLVYQYNLQQYRQKWHLKQQQSQQTVYPEPIYVKYQDK